MDIKIVMFKNEDSVIAEVEQLSMDSIYKLTNAVQLINHPGTNKPTFIPFPQFRHKNAVLTIQNDDVLCTADLEEGLEKAYLTAHGKIITPSKTLVGV